MKSLFLLQKGTALLGQEELTLAGLGTEFKKFFPHEDPRYIDDVSKLAGLAAGRAWEIGPGPKDETARKDFAVIMGSAFGAIDSTVDFDAQALQKGPNAVNPMDFPNTVANAAGSRIGIWLQLKGPNVTLTNGGTSFLDALGFAWQGLNDGLFQDCFVGAVDKVPSFLKPAVGTSALSFLEGCSLFLASGSPKGKPLAQVTGFFSLQLGTDLRLPSVFMDDFNVVREGVEWLGCPERMPLTDLLPKALARFSPPPTTWELGLGGLVSMNRFLAGSHSSGLVGFFSAPERKVSFIKVSK